MSQADGEVVVRRGDRVQIRVGEDVVIDVALGADRTLRMTIGAGGGRLLMIDQGQLDALICGLERMRRPRRS